MKKVLAAALLCSVYAFAAWDKFPVIEDGKGEVKLGFEQSRQGDDIEPFNFNGFKIRYSPLAGLELTSQNDADVFHNYVLGARYQIIPVLSAGVDIGFPLGMDAVWSFKPNVQFSMPLTSSLTLGSNFDLAIYTESKDHKYGRGLDFTGGIELDLALSEKSTVWLGFDAETGVTRSKVDGKPSDGIPLKQDTQLGNRLLTLTPAVGYLVTLGNLDLGTYVSLGFGGEKEINSKGEEEAKNFTTAVGVEASVRF
jgi:hypothetical protein